MSHQISRRRLAHTASWALPAVALSSAAPAQAASNPAIDACGLAEAALGSAGCPVPGSLLMPIFKAPPTSMSGVRGVHGIEYGDIHNYYTTHDVTFSAQCSYPSAVTVSWTATSGLGASLPPATAQMKDGSVLHGRAETGYYFWYTGGSTLEQTGNPTSQEGLYARHTVQWDLMFEFTRAHPKKMEGAIVREPFLWTFTDAAGNVHSCSYALTYTYSDSTYWTWSNEMINPQIVPL